MFHPSSSPSQKGSSLEEALSRSVARRDEVKFARGDWNLAQEILERIMQLAMARGAVGDRRACLVLSSGSPEDGFDASCAISTLPGSGRAAPGIASLAKRVADALSPVGVKVRPGQRQPGTLRFIPHTVEAWNLEPESSHFLMENEGRLLDLLEEIGIPRAEAEALIAAVG